MICAIIVPLCAIIVPMSQHHTHEPITKTTPCPWGPGPRKLVPTELSSYEKRWLGSQLVFEKTTTPKLSERFGLKPELLRKYKKKVNDSTPFYSGAGKPCLIDDISKENLHSKTKGQVLKRTLEEFKEDLYEEAKGTVERAGSSYTFNLNKPCDRSAQRWWKSLGYTQKNAE